MSKCKPVKAHKPLAWVLQKSNQIKVEKQLLTLSNYAWAADANSHTISFSQMFI